MNKKSLARMSFSPSQNFKEIEAGKQKNSGGFTLIELLVVIAIIGILASVVLASLNSARSKGADAAIKSGLANLRAQAEIYYDGVGVSTYGLANTCSVTNTGTVTCSGGVTSTYLMGDATFSSGVKAAAAASGSTGYANVTATAPVAWAAFVPLKTAPTSYWCVDSTGKSASSTPATTDTVCP